MKRPTRDDVAQLAGVSGWTVSKVINGNLDSRISDETRGRVMDAVHQLGYRPNQTARALATGATHVIAVCADMRSPYSFKVINRFQSLFKEYGYRILIIDLDQALNSPQISLGPVDGFISLDSQEGIERFIQSNGNLHIPFVSMGVYYTEYRDHITIDIYNSSLQALKHLFDIGCKQIAYLQPRTPYPFAGDPRYDAYMNFTKNYMIKPELITVPGDSRQEAMITIQEYAASHKCPDGIFCHNDDKAIGVYKGLRDMGIKVPEDTAIIGCDGIADTEYLDNRLSTIIQPVDEMCRISWDFLQHRIEDYSIPVQTAILQSTLAIRESAMRSQNI